MATKMEAETGLFDTRGDWREYPDRHPNPPTAANERQKRRKENERNGTLNPDFFFGTTYPLFVEIFTNKRISVGEPYFNSTIVPILIAAMKVWFSFKADMVDDSREITMVQKVVLFFQSKYTLNLGYKKLAF